MLDQNIKMSYTNVSNVTNITTAATITSSTDSGNLSKIIMINYSNINQKDKLYHVMSFPLNLSTNF